MNRIESNRLDLVYPVHTSGCRGRIQWNIDIFQGGEGRFWECLGGGLYYMWVWWWEWGEGGRVLLLDFLRLGWGVGVGLVRWVVRFYNSVSNFIFARLVWDFFILMRHFFRGLFMCF